MCGGTTRVVTAWLCVVGLSPRVRGNLLRFIPVGFTVRSIPACAGEPHKMRTLPSIMPVYPRVCGGTPPNPWVAAG